MEFLYFGMGALILAFGYEIGRRVNAPGVEPKPITYKMPKIKKQKEDTLPVEDEEDERVNTFYK